MITASGATLPADAVEQRLREMIDLHLHPRHGSEFWLQRADESGIDLRREIRTLDDLSRLGTMNPADLLGRPLRQFVPRALHGQWSRMTVAQTGGTAGPGAWTAYLDDEFEEAFIAPFASAAGHVGFPQKGVWLYVGPSGPHIIGKASRSLARVTGSADPFSVDFDPRWAKRLPAESMAFARYLDHVVQQAMDVVEQQPVSVIFTTPAVLARLGELMSASQRAGIRGVHYGGMTLSREALWDFQTALLPNAVHLSGYGNTLFGCCMEISAAAGRALEYFPFGDRLVFETIEDSGVALPSGSTGQVCFTRLDRSMLILRMRERDAAQLCSPPATAPSGFRACGVRDPHSPLALAPNLRPGIY